MKDPYKFADADVLANLYGIKDARILEIQEREATVQRLAEGVPKGDFGPDHVAAIHRHLFQDVYPWAGEFRTVPISKGGNAFADPEEIRPRLTALHKEIAARSNFRGLDAAEFGKMATIATAMLNSVHPFREGNGRTQIAWLMRLGEDAGHPINPMPLPAREWMLASREAFAGGLARMGDLIGTMVRLGGRRDAPALGNPAPSKERDRDDRER